MTRISIIPTSSRRCSCAKRSRSILRSRLSSRSPLPRAPWRFATQCADRPAAHHGPAPDAPPDGHLDPRYIGPYDRLAPVRTARCGSLAPRPMARCGGRRRGFRRLRQRGPAPRSGAPARRDPRPPGRGPFQPPVAWDGIRRRTRPLSAVWPISAGSAAKSGGTIRRRSRAVTGWRLRRGTNGIAFYAKYPIGWGPFRRHGSHRRRSGRNDSASHGPGHRPGRPGGNPADPPAQPADHRGSSLAAAPTLRNSSVLGRSAAAGADDSSNTLVEFTRNRIRHQLLPALERDYNPRVAEAVQRLGDLARQAQHVLDALVASLHTRCVTSPRPATLRSNASSCAISPPSWSASC